MPAQPVGRTSHPASDSGTAGASLDTVPVPYRLVAVHDRTELQALERRLGAARFDATLRLNRIDRKHVHDRDSLVVPAAAALDSLSPFPAGIPEARGISRLLLVSTVVQAFAAYDSGQRVRWGPTSTGRETSPTPAGLYHTNWKQPQRTSTVNDEWLLKWYVNLESRLGISLHEYDLPGRPASHSCVRLLEDDAHWIYDWSQTWTLDPVKRSHVLRQGTPVVVLGAYAFDARRPWRNLPLDAHATDVPADTIVAALRAYALAPADTAAMLPSGDLPHADPPPASGARR